MKMISVDELFDKSRFGTTNPLSPILLLVYMPIGFCLLLLRVLMSFQYILLFSILPKHWIVRRILMRIYLFFMGILVTSAGHRFKSKNATLLVSNHITKVDSIVLEAVIPSYRLDVSQIPKLIITLMRWTYTKQTGELPCSLFPEGEATNGKGMLKFKKDLFNNPRLDADEALIQPVVLMVNRSWLIPVKPTTLFSTFWSDLFWCLFLPFTQFHINYLPSKKYSLNDEKYIETLQKEMAFVLDVEATNITLEDKLEFMKRVEHEIRQENILAARLNDNDQYLSPRSASERQASRRSKMVDQVKAVLPQVPMVLIHREINRTKNVDQTISDLLDGSVKYTPLTEEEQKKENEDIRKTFTSNTTKQSQRSFSSNLGKLSLAERKKIMIDNARRKYLEKHPEYL